MFIVQVCSGVLPRYLSHYLTTESGSLSPVITVSKAKALPMGKEEADEHIKALVHAWPLVKAIEV